MNLPWSAPQANSESLSLLRLFGLCAVLATVTGRALSPALLGSASGISEYIRVSSWVSGFLAQLFAVGGVSFAVLFLFKAMRSDVLPLAAKALMIPSAFLVLLGVMISMRVEQLDPQSTLALALAAGVTALAGVPALLRVAELRAQGLTLFGCGASALLHTLGRLFALRASLDGEASQFFWARLLETLAFVAELGVLGLVTTWLARRTGRAASLKAVTILSVAVLLSGAALLTNEYEAGPILVLASRSMGELLREPSPFVPDLLRGSVEFAAFGAAVWAFAAARPVAAAATLGLCLLARGATDIPLLALALSIAALAAFGPSSDGMRSGQTGPSPDSGR